MKAARSVNIGRITLTAASLAVLLAMLGTGCSSAPKRPPEIFTTRNAAVGQLDLANRAVSIEDFVNAHLFLDESWRLAVSTDDNETRVKVLLSRGNAWFNQGNRESAEKAWTEALLQAEQNRTLTAIARIYLARSTLPEGTDSDLSREERQQLAVSARAIAKTEMSAIKGEPLYTAFAWKVIGLAEKELGNWREAETALKAAVSIHEKNRYLEDTAYDWYLIASVRSKAGQYATALSALETALTFDRRAENTNGLGMIYLAIGAIHEKAGDQKKAREAYSRALEIFESGFLENNAVRAREKLAALGEN